MYASELHSIMGCYADSGERPTPALSRCLLLRASLPVCASSWQLRRCSLRAAACAVDAAS